MFGKTWALTLALLLGLSGCGTTGGDTESPIQGMRDTGTAAEEGREEKTEQTQGEKEESLPPAVEIAPAGKVLAIGYSHTAGLKQNGRVVACGPKGGHSRGQCKVSNGWEDIISLDAGGYFTAGLRADGTVVVAGGYVYTEDWRDIVEIKAAGSLLAGLKSDGTVVAAGRNDEGGCEVSGWTDIAEIEVGSLHVVGIKKDGSALVSGTVEDDQFDVGDWKLCLPGEMVAREGSGRNAEMIEKNISRNAVIAAAWDDTYGLRSDGSVIATTEALNLDSGVKGLKAVVRGRWNVYALSAEGRVLPVMIRKPENIGIVSGWTDIVALGEVGWGDFVAGVKSDGTVVVSDSEHEDYDIEGWTDMATISAGNEHIVGLKSNGTVVADGDNYYEECKVSDWTDMVAVAAGNSYTVGLRADGTVVATGDNDYGQCDVSDWKDIVAITAGQNHTAGLKADGTMVSAGECDVSGLTGIAQP